MGLSSGAPKSCLESLTFPLQMVFFEKGGGLNISGKVKCVPLQFGKGDGRMLQVIEQHLDLRGDTTRNPDHFLLLLFSCIFTNSSSFLSDCEVFNVK